MNILNSIKKFLKRNKIWKDPHLSYWQYQTQELMRKNTPEYLGEQQKIENERIYKEYSTNRYKHEIEKNNDIINCVIEHKLKYGQNFIVPDSKKLIIEYNKYLSRLNKIQKDNNLFLTYDLFIYHEEFKYYLFCYYKIYLQNFSKHMKYDDSIITIEQLEERFKKEYL